MLQHHLAQRALRPDAAADALDHLARERVVVEQHHVGVEQRELLGAHATAQFLADRQHLFAHALHRVLEQAHLGLGILAGPVRHAFRSEGGETTTTRPTAMPGEPGTPGNSVARLDGSRGLPR